jgi:hypothetical protein
MVLVLVRSFLNALLTASNSLFLCERESHIKMLKLLSVKYSQVFLLLLLTSRANYIVYSLQDILMMFDDDKVKGWIIR